MKKSFCSILLIFIVKISFAQFADSAALLPPLRTEDSLRIINLNPYFNQHVDSTLSYQFQINRDQSKYYWFLQKARVYAYGQHFSWRERS
jgi:hypothetical protein